MLIPSVKQQGFVQPSPCPHLCSCDTTHLFMFYNFYSHITFTHVSRCVATCMQGSILQSRASAHVIAAVCVEDWSWCYPVFVYHKQVSQKPTKLDGNDTMQNTFTPSLHLVPFCHHLHKLCVCYNCVHRRVVEGSAVGIAGCVVHVHVHGEWVKCYSTCSVYTM